MKEGIKLFFVNILALFFVLSLFSESFHLPFSLIYLLATLSIGSVALIITCPFLNFLTVKCNFITYLLMGTIILGVFLYIMNLFMIDYAVKEFTFSGFTFGNFIFKEFEVLPIVSIAVASLSTTFLVAIYKELDRR